MGLFGTTIGKFIFNIKVMDSRGNKITYDIAFKRSLMVWVYGYGLGIPILSLITLIKSHADLQEKLKTKWDKKYDLTVIHGSINVIRVVAAILIIVGLPIIQMIIIRLI